MDKYKNFAGENILISPKELKINNPDIKLINVGEEYFDIDKKFELNILYSKDDINVVTIGNWSDYIMVIKNDKPIMILSEYEMMNEIVFSNVLILPGRDCITTVDLTTLEYKRHDIR